MRKEMTFRMIHAILLVCIIIGCFGNFIGIKEPIILHWIIAVLWSGIIALMNYGKNRERILCSITLVACLFLFILFFGLSETNDFLINYSKWLLNGEGWNQEWLRGYELIQTLIVSSVCYVFQIVLEKYHNLQNITALGLFLGMLYYMLSHTEMNRFGVLIAIGYIQICYIEKLQRTWKKKKTKSSQEYILWIMPFCVTYMVLLFFMPTSSKPYDWKFIKEAYNNIREDFTILQQNLSRNGKEDFAAGKTGFSEDGKLLSGIADSNQQLLTVEGNQSLMTNVYLTGKVYDTFNGTEWVQTITENSNEHLLDTIETIYAIERYDKEGKNNYICTTGLNIDYKYIHTNCVFAPLKLRYIDGCDYQECGTNLIFDRKKGYGTSYKAFYFQINIDHPKFYEMAETTLEDDDETLARLVEYYKACGGKQYHLEELKCYQDRIKEQYTPLTSLSPKALTYLHQITGEKPTTIQKLRAIEKELSSYTYAKTPGKLPDSINNPEEFLDYFLFDSQKGYCSYFATAFVLMARAEGIPARYVEGFCIPATKNRTVSVTADMAHAWPEVYLDGIGWIPFEPTPGYEEVRYTPWEMKEKQDYDSFPAEDNELDIILSENSDYKEKDIDNYKIQWILYGGILTIIFVCIFLLVIEQILFRRRVLYMTIEEQFLLEIRKTLWILSKLGVKRQEYETLNELQENVRKQLPYVFGNKMSFAFFKGYEEYLYRNKHVEKETLQETILEQKQILTWLKCTRRWYYYTILIRIQFIR